MQKWIGNLEKLKTALEVDQAKYWFEIGGTHVAANDLIGLKIRLTFMGEINCTECGKKTKKPYSGGYCYPCSIKLPECDMCILKPELCHFKSGTCRDSAWGELNCNIPHFIYLANSSGLKVGITRTTQVPTRWIDQGASFALPIFKVKTRLQSGLIEKLISSEINDKTDWRKMLKGNIEEIDLEEKRDEIFEMFASELDHLDEEFGGSALEFLENENVTKITYPVTKYPEKVSSLSFEKNSVIEDVLVGIKGQYLIFSNGVINIRNQTGYKIELEIL
jgi:hypothetical protein